MVVLDTTVAWSDLDPKFKSIGVVRSVNCHGLPEVFPLLLSLSSQQKKTSGTRVQFFRFKP